MRRETLTMIFYVKIISLYTEIFSSQNSVPHLWPQRISIINNSLHSLTRIIVKPRNIVTAISLISLGFLVVIF